MIRVTIDIPGRPRLTRTPLLVHADGRTWDLSLSSNVFVDPITRTGFRLPQVLSATWETSAAGLYARLARSDYQTQAGVALTSAEWAENNYRFSGDIRLESRGVNYAVFTNATQPINRAMFLSFFVEAGANQGDVALECGWGEPGVSTTVSLRVFGSGRCQVYKGTQYLADYSISGASVEVLRASGQAQGTGQGVGSATGGAPGAGDVLGRVVNLYMVPCRRRELLVFSSSGGGFSHVFEDLDPDIVNAITVAGRFWWRVAQGKASVQCAPFKYPNPGYLIGPLTLLREPPGAGEVPGFLIADDAQGSGGTAAATPSLTSGSNVAAAFVADGVNYETHLRVDLTGDDDTTRFVYALDASFGVDTAELAAGSEEDITDYVQRVSFFVPEDAGGVRGDIVLRGPQDMDDAGIDRIDSQSSRPFKIEVQTPPSIGDYKPFIVGYTGEPARDEGPVVGASDRARVVTLEWEDLYRQLMDARYEDEGTSLDGLGWKDAIEQQLFNAGIPSVEWDVEDIAFTLPYTTAFSKGEISEPVEAGVTAGEVLKRLIRDYAATYYAGFSPVDTGTVASGVRFRLQSPTALGDTPAALLYLDGLPGGAPLNAYDARRTFRERVLPPEATRVAVVGFDPRKGIYLIDRDSAASLENPALPPTLRPDGWVGTVRPVEAQDPRWTTPDVVTRVLEQLMERLAVSERVAEWESDLLAGLDGVPLWRGDVVTVAGKGRYRIESFSGSFENEAEGFTMRRINYIGRRIGDEL